MRTDTIYEESIASKGTAGVFAVMAAVMFSLTAYQLLSSPLGESLVLTAIFLVMGAVFLDLARNFYRLLIRITPAEITVGFGLFRHRCPWHAVQSCRVDETSIPSFAGWAIRLSKVDDVRRLVYRVMPGPRVELSVTMGRFREIAFSTGNPEEVARIVKKHAGMMGGAM